jgi:hypothetical protein
MCVICTLTGNANVSRKRMVIREFYKNIAATVASVKDDGAMANFYIELLRETADDIENNLRSSQAVADVMTGVEKDLDAKRVKVESMLLGAETTFYQNYGMVMPDSVRTKVKAELWDSMEKEQVNG